MNIVFFQGLMINNALVNYDSRSNTFQARCVQNGDIFEVCMHELKITLLGPKF